MTSEEFQNLRTAFDRLLAASEPQRAAMLDQMSQSHAAMADELKRMVSAHDRITSVLDHPIAPRIAADSPPVRDNLHIGPYRIEKQLGIGGMGIVYLATRADGSFERRVAIKLLRHDRIDRLFLSRFQQERQILAQLNHPHIASILDAGKTADGDPYFVMEYVDGVPITEYCKTHALPTERKLDLFLQICDAIQHAHRNLTVHRDLKPGNVLVTEAGAVKLLDFGIAKLIEQPQDSLSEMPPSVVLLTPEYSSPEQIRREPITTATDVFALGILLYELLSGEHPFRRKGQLPHEVMRAICDDDPPPPSAAAPRLARELRGDLDTITLAALRKQPAWRYPSVELLAEDVRRYRRAWPIQAKGNRRWYRVQKFVRRQWLPLTAAVLLILALSGGIVATSYQARRADQARAVAESERSRAEAERVASDLQRSLAQHAQEIAVEQRRVADARTREAEIERQKEQQRYREVRSLASSLLFDLYDGVRDLAGSTTARRLMVSKAQHQLEVLTADGGDDIELQRDVAACYERMGELQVDPHSANQTAAKNDAAAALDSYRKAVDLRRHIIQLPGSRPQDRRDLALSLAKLGEGMLRAGDAKQSVGLVSRRLGSGAVSHTGGAVGCVDATGAGNHRRTALHCPAGDGKHRRRAAGLSGGYRHADAAGRENAGRCRGAAADCQHSRVVCQCLAPVAETARGRGACQAGFGIVGTAGSSGAEQRGVSKAGVVRGGDSREQSGGERQYHSEPRCIPPVRAVDASRDRNRS